MRSVEHGDPEMAPIPPHARIAPAKPWRSSISLGGAASLEHQHSARDFAGLHRAKGVVDVLEAAAARDHLVEQEPSLTVELQVQRNVEAEAVAAPPPRLHPALRPDR